MSRAPGRRGPDARGVRRGNHRDPHRRGVLRIDREDPDGCLDRAGLRDAPSWWLAGDGRDRPRRRLRHLSGNGAGLVDGWRPSMGGGALVRRTGRPTHRRVAGHGRRGRSSCWRHRNPVCPRATARRSPRYRDDRDAGRVPAVDRVTNGAWAWDDGDSVRERLRDRVLDRPVTFRDRAEMPRAAVRARRHTRGEGILAHALPFAYCRTCRCDAARPHSPCAPTITQPPDMYLSAIRASAFHESTPITRTDQENDVRFLGASALICNNEPQAGR